MELLKADVHGSVVLRSVFLTFGSKAVAGGAGFLLNLMLARQLGTAGYGLFSYVLSLTLLLSALSCVGLGQAATRLVAGYVVQQQWMLMRGFVRWSRIFVFLSSTAVAAAVVLYTEFLSSVPTDERRTLLIGSVALIIGSMIMVQAGVLRGLKCVAVAELVETGGLRSLVGILFLVAFFGSGDYFYSAPQGMAVILLSTAFSLIAVTIVLTRAFPLQARGCGGTYQVRGWLTTALPMFLIAAATLGQSQINILMLRYLAPIEEVGAFAAAARLAMLVGFGLGTVNAALAPVVAEMHAIGRHKDLQRIIYQTSLLTSAAALLVLFAGIIGGRYALELFGPGFEDAYDALVILLAAEGFNALAGSTGCLMTMIGLQRSASVIVIIAFIVSVGLNAAMIPHYGMTGAAATALVSTIICNTAMMVYLYVKAGLRSTPIFILIDHVMRLRPS